MSNKPSSLKQNETKPVYCVVCGEYAGIRRKRSDTKPFFHEKCLKVFENRRAAEDLVRDMNFDGKDTMEG